MSLPIAEILKGATSHQKSEAIHYTSDHLHVPDSQVSVTVAVAYVVRHFKAGQLEGWDGFVTDLQPATNRR